MEKRAFEGTSVGAPKEPEPSYLENLIHESQQIRSSTESINRRVWNLLRAVNAGVIPPTGSATEATPEGGSLLPQLASIQKKTLNIHSDIEEALDFLEQTLRNTGANDA